MTCRISVGAVDTKSVDPGADQGARDPGSCARWPECGEDLGPSHGRGRCARDIARAPDRGWCGCHPGPGTSRGPRCRTRGESLSDALFGRRPLAGEPWARPSRAGDPPVGFGDGIGPRGTAGSKLSGTGQPPPSSWPFSPWSGLFRVPLPTPHKFPRARPMSPSVLPQGPRARCCPHIPSLDSFGAGTTGAIPARTYREPG